MTASPISAGDAAAPAGAPAAELDAEALYRLLLRGVAALCAPGSRLVGISTGGAWLAARLHADLKLPGEHGVISSAMHRDDFAKRGLSAREPTRLPFDINGAHVVLIDDVLYTGRTIRAVINELFDFGRPAAVKLAVLIDRNGRQLPIQPDFAATRVKLSSDQSLAMQRDAGGLFMLRVEAPQQT